MLILLAMLCGGLLVGAWALRLHDTNMLNQRICRSVERTNTALRLVIQVRLEDPTTPEAVKQVFRMVLAENLRPINCSHLAAL